MADPFSRFIASESRRFLSGFDSSTTMLRALAAGLQRRSLPACGLPKASQAIMLAGGHLPTGVRRSLYEWGGELEAVRTSVLPLVRAEDIVRWVIGHYPAPRYPGAMFGSSNGAAVHLALALGFPWLPQTFLIPIRHRGIPPDDFRTSYRMGREEGPKLLGAEPRFQLHHMHDPNQDRLMIQHMAYFRVKLLHPTDGYLGFLEERLEPGSRVFIVDCQTTWPCTKVGERHYFQAGATGGIPPESYLNGGREVREFLAREGSELGVWDPPAPDAESPEAEWGYEDAADDSLKDLCRDRHFELWRIRFQQPEDLSGPVAGFYRAWYERNGLPADRLLVDNFFLIDPQPTIRAAAVPFWTRFSVLLSVEAAHRFLDDVAGFDEIFVSPFSHGVRSLGVATPDRWQEVIHRGRSGGFLGAAPERFPQDFGVFVRFSRALRGLVRCAVPPRPSFSDLQEALDRGPLAHNITLTREV